jgi:serine/threonine-protein kinase
MKTCPTCRRSYPDAKQFCEGDGARLVVVTASAKPADELPTAVTSLPQPAVQPAPPPLPVPKAAPKPAARAASASPSAEPQPLKSDKETLITSIAEGDADDDIPYLGTLIADRYLVLSLIGRGGMGSVYKAEQIHLRKQMAVKLLHEGMSGRKQLISRFTREARAISRLSSPHTVMVYDFGRWNDLFYLVMELMEGEALDAVLEREGPMDAERTTRLVLQMCDSLSEAHKAGIVHRDLKPENVMLVRNQSRPDFVKILDFGLAKVQGVDDPYTIHSQRDIFGTPYYMSPEQIRAAGVDARSDIYAVGALMFRMLTGKYVFSESNTFDILKAHLMEPPPRMSDALGKTVPEALEQIVAKALAKEPEQRFASMEALAEALQQAQATDYARSDALPVVEPPRSKPSAPALEPVQRPPVAAETEPDDDEADPQPGQALQTSKWRTAAFVLLPLLLLAGGVAWLLANDRPVLGKEVEPNGDLKTASHLDAQLTATGILGKRTSATQADIDCFRLPPIGERDELTLKVEGERNSDIALRLLGADGKQVVQFSHAGKGRGESLRHIDGQLRPAAVCVTQQLAPGEVPVENVSETYRLRVETSPRRTDDEREPNDGEGREAGELASGSAIVGSLDGALDRDAFVLQGAPDGKLVRLVLEWTSSAQARVALVDAARRTLAARLLRPDESKAVLEFAAEPAQLPDRVVLTRLDAGQPLAAETTYKLHYEIAELAEQTVPTSAASAEQAAEVALGVWQQGVCDTGDHWLRIDGGDPTMKSLRLEVDAKGGAALQLTVRDLGQQVDLRKWLVPPGAPQTTVVPGSGGGFLVRVQPADAARRGKPGEARYRLRARYVTP